MRSGTMGLAALAGLIAGGGMMNAAWAQTGYVNTVLVANDASYEPLVMVDPLLINGWGVAIRPPGAGGHFWISNAGTGTTTTYVGDVHDAQGGFRPLFQDALTVVDIAQGAGERLGRPTAEVPIVTGQVFNYSSSDFVVSGEGITAASKFIFVTGEGTISGWTEQRDAQNVLRRQTVSVLTRDNSQTYDNDVLQYTGCAVTDLPSGNRLYVTHFSAGRVEVFDHLWQPVPMPPGAFTVPGLSEEYAAWNIQHFRTGPNGEGRLWLAFALREEPWEEDPAFGAVAEFDLEGNFLRRFTTALDTDPFADMELKAPWGLALAPANFGPLSNTMLVANFGDGTIAAFDIETGGFVDYLRDSAGQVVIVDGVWGLTFGNGVALGDSNALYYAAGPNNEEDGTFGTIRYVPSTCPTIKTGPADARVCGEAGVVSLSLDAPAPTRTIVRWEVLNAQGGGWARVAEGANAGFTAAGADRTTITLGGFAPGFASAVIRGVVSNECGSAVSEPALVARASADFDADGDAGTDADIESFFACLAGSCCATCGTSDFDADGDAGTDADIEAFFRVLAGGAC